MLNPFSIAMTFTGIVAATALGCATKEHGAPRLQAELDEMRDRWQEQAPSELVETYDQGVRDVAESGVMKSALRQGDLAPGFQLPSARGGPVSLAGLLEDGPVVIMWYRGGWCPYCNTQFAAMRRAWPDFQERGATLVAISPEVPEKARETAEANEVSFPVLSDVGNRTAAAYGVDYVLPAQVAKTFEGKFDLAAYNADDSNRLPLAAAYVVDTDGVIQYAFVDADYRMRAEPADLLAALDALPR